MAKGAKPPKPVKNKMNTLKVEQLNSLLAAEKEKTPVYFPIITGAVHTVTRKSEFIGLNWDNVDLSAQKIYICQTITEANGKYFFNPLPKGKETRGVKLTTELAKLMQSLKAEHDQRKKALGETYNPHNLVFCNSKGNIMAPSEISRALKRALKAAGLLNIHFYDIRHSHATILLKAKVHPKIVSERLGHSKFSFTMDIYSHVTDSIEELAVNTLDEILD